MKPALPARWLDELTTQLGRVVPPDIRAAREDLNQNFRAVVRSYLDRLDVVSREEFDIQREVLRRTREKVEELETKLAERES